MGEGGGRMGVGGEGELEGSKEAEGREEELKELRRIGSRANGC